MAEEKKDKPPKRDIKKLTVVNDVVLTHYTLTITVSEDSTMNIHGVSYPKGKDSNSNKPNVDEKLLDMSILIYDSIKLLSEFSPEFQQAMADIQEEIEILIIEEYYPEGDE